MRIQQGRAPTVKSPLDARRGAVLRAARAALAMSQSEALQRSGLGETTLLDAEKDRRCSEKTFQTLASVYSKAGIEIEEGPPFSFILRLL